MSSYGSPGKFRSRYKTYHRQAAGHSSSWSEWVDGKEHAQARSGRSVAVRIFSTIAILFLLGGALYGFVMR